MTRRRDDDFAPLSARDVQARESTGYPEPFAARVKGRARRRLAATFGLRHVGVNLTTLAPGAQSALMHRHSAAEEFIYILSGAPLLRTDVGGFRLKPGMCAGFPPNGVAHHLVNDTDALVTYLEIGDNPADDSASYPEDDLRAERDANGRWQFLRRDGRLYDE